MIPVGQWGVQELLPAYSKRPHLFPRKTLSLKAGDPVDLSDLQGKPLTAEVLHEATDRIMAAITRTGRGPARREGAGRALRPEGLGRRARSATRTRSRSGRADDPGRGLRRRFVGYGVQHRARRRGQRRDDLGPARGGVRPDQQHPRERRLLPGHRAARDDHGDARPGARPLPVRSSSSSRCPRRPSAATSSEWAAELPSDAVFVSLMKGIELGTTKRMSEVIAEVTGAGPERIAVVSGPNLAREIALREPAASVVACDDEDVAERLQDAVHSRAFRPYRSTDVLGCELGGAYKNVVGAVRRHGGRARLRRQHHGLADHPRAGRDRAAGDEAGRRPAHADGAGRARRPGRHLLLAALAQPHLRREARARA